MVHWKAPHDLLYHPYIPFSVQYHTNYVLILTFYFDDMLDPLQVYKKRLNTEVTVRTNKEVERRLLTYVSQMENVLPVLSMLQSPHITATHQQEMQEILGMPAYEYVPSKENRHVNCLVDFLNILKMSNCVESCALWCEGACQALCVTLLSSPSDLPTNLSILRTHTHHTINNTD